MLDKKKLRFFYLHFETKIIFLFLSGQVSVFVRKQLLTTMDEKKGLGFLYS